jgi:hypothetical protein
VLATPPGEGEQQREALAPLFDNGTSLGMERHIQHVAKWSDKQYQAYIRRGCHHMKWGNGDVARCGHFELVDKFVRANPTRKEALRQKLGQFSLQVLEQSLTELCRLDLPVRLTEDRLRFTLKLTQLRYKQLCAILS